MKLRLALAAAAAGVVAASGATAAPVTANATAQANIVAPAALTATRDLEFGTIAKPTVGSTTVTVASAASATATPSVSGGNGFVPIPGQARAATFRLIGTPGQTYTVDANTLSFTGAAGNLTSIAAEAPVSAGGSLLTLPGSGVDDLYIGGRFTISPTTTVQAYSGTLSLTINFN